jgi:tRNA threonylcarbamoyl adenosine modification protein (Sua5/YciO/YrdC/YwlC family)
VRASVPESFERCIGAGGVVVFPADTVYGIACDPDNRFAVERLYLLKRRERSKPSAVMFFDVDSALAALPELGERTREALGRLLPGGVTVLLPNPARRFSLACGDDPLTLGLRVPVVPLLHGVRVPVLQSSANRAGGEDPPRLGDVPELLRAAADLVLDGGDLPGTPSTVIDLRRFEEGGIDAVSVIRYGAVSEESVAAALAGQFHFNPATYLEMIRADVPVYDALQDEVVAASGWRTRRILELGTGTGETARRLLARHPDASLLGIDESEAMLRAAAAVLGAERVSLLCGRLEDPLPSGPFDLVASALCVHHLDGPGKADLFTRVREVLGPGGRFVLGDVVIPEAPGVAATPLTPGFDKPSTVADQLEWLRDAGFDARVSWSHGDLAVIVAEPRVRVTIR